MNIHYDTGKTSHGLQGEIYFTRDVGEGQAQTAYWHENGFLDMSLSTTPSTAGIRFKNNIWALSWANAAGTNSISPLFVNNLDQVILAPGGQDVVVPGTFSVANADANQFRIASDPGTNIRSTNTGFLDFFTGGVEKLRVQPAGVRLFSELFFNVDNTYDLGKVSGSNFRPRDGYFGRDLDVGGVYKVDGVKVLANQCASIPNSNGSQADDTRAINAILDCLRSHGIVAQ
jgi:hypothetical protein